MKIVFIRSNPVSPYPRLEKTVNSLKKYGYEIHILAWDRSQKYNQKNSTLNLSDCNVPITRFGIPGKFGGGFKANFFSLLKFQFKVFKWLYKNRKSYNAIHAYDFDTGYVALKSARLFNKKLVYDIPDYYVDSHGIKGSIIGRYVQKAENNIINRADAVIICTEKRKQQIIGTKPNKLTIIHNSPVNLVAKSTDNLQLFDNNSTKLKIVYVGILAGDRFIKEIADLVINRGDCEFHIGGYGNLEDYFIKLSNLHENIYFYGKLPYNDTLNLEKHCDVITAIYDPKIPNNYFAAPNKFYESLMLGKPLIMVNNTGMDDILASNEIGEVIEYSVESLNGAINRLMEKRDKWVEMSKRSKKLYDEKYSWEIMEKRLIDLYAQL
ncbi:glycosyltransferase family 4 protein [Cytobacillus sp. Sa5YUA1]|uniref:Glycosyltransferase family 4 protein n=1 Tax=Cytobacillus stercorigallinarum TaxID=2762240 RepID=A0ABR8QSW9_9BACI|nr:glycosyltransferase family 4 protein [Cytobacillus stercorigallinarum]MBD7938625.1 glycosyltransferase family 4 protein [Cytobacillus stercorigallinarum]